MNKNLGRFLGAGQIKNHYEMVWAIYQTYSMTIVDVI